MNPNAEEPQDTIGPSKYAEEPAPLEDNLPGELPEKDFVNTNGFKKNPSYFWIWTGLISALMMLFWGGFNWYGKTLNTYFSKSPFLQVTNRELSLFLWQFPQYLRQNVSNRTNYLTGFEYESKVGIKEGYAGNFVVAPPEVLFLYHTWDRLLKNEFTQRKVPKAEFLEFLFALPEWNAAGWPDAPEGYKKLLDNLSGESENNLADLPASVFPIEVRMAFQGWKNFYKEGDAINEASYTYEELEAFLKKNPNYARNYWINIVKDDYPEYLQVFTKKKFKSEAIVPTPEMTPFLKVALFNWKQAKEGK